MVNPIQKFGRWLFNIPEGDVVRYPIDEELIKRDKQIKAQQQQLLGHQAQLAKVSAEKREKHEEERKKDYTDAIAKKANEEEDKIRSKRFKHTFSLRYFFNQCGSRTTSKKFPEGVDLTDKDDKTIFGKFGDMLITDNGYICITDSNNEVISLGRDFNQVIWKPEALANYMKRKRIPLAVDEDMRAVPDLEEEEHPDIIYNSKDDTYEEALYRLRPVKDMLIEREEKIRELQRYAERIEKSMIEIQNNLQNEKRVRRLLENRESNAKADVSSILGKHMEYENRVGEMHSQINKLSELKAMNESLIEKYQYVVRSLMVKLEKAGDMSIYELAKEEFRSDADFWKNIIPETVITQIPEDKTREVAQPGQPMVRRA